MPNRITDSGSNSSALARVNSHRVRSAMLQERISTGKRINRPSEDPTGYQDTVRLRTSQNEIEQFRRNAKTVNQKITATDDSLNQYEQLLERVRTLVSRGLSDTTAQEGKNAIAAEIDNLRERILQTANAKYNDEFLFGGTRQNEAPFDPTTAAPAVTPTSVQYVQIEPGVKAIPVGAAANTVFSDATSDVFTDLTAAAAAIRGTGDPVADRATLQNSMIRVNAYTNLSNVAHAQIGANMKGTELVLERLDSDYLSYDTRATDIEGADFAESAIELVESERALEATLEITGRGKRSLLDFLS